MKNLSRLTVLFLMLVTVFFACTKREQDEKPNFPSAEFFSPWYVFPGDTVEIYGANLEGSQVYINGSEVGLLDTDGALTFLVPEGLDGGVIKVVYPNGESFTFADSLHYVPVNDSRRTDLEGVILLSNFDGGGIRPTTIGSDFSTGSWETEAPVGSEYGIGSNYNGISSPVGGNYYYNYVPDGAIGGVATSGWAGKLNTRNELMNDNETVFPLSFADYPNSPVDFDGNASDYYLNFYYKSDVLETNRNGENPTEIRVFLVNPTLKLEDQFAFTISNGDNISEPSINMPSDEEWHGISIPLNKFKSNYGFDSPLKNADLKSFNAVQFNFADSRVNSSIDEEIEEADGAIRVYIDEVSISKGTNIYEIP